MPHDYLIRDWREAGLEKPSIARADRIAEIPAGYLGSAGSIGKLSNGDIAAIERALSVMAQDLLQSAISSRPAIWNSLVLILSEEG